MKKTMTAFCILMLVIAIGLVGIIPPLLMMLISGCAAQTDEPWGGFWVAEDCPTFPQKIGKLKAAEIHQLFIIRHRFLLSIDHYEQSDN